MSEYKRILFSGGITLGPVAPLLSVAHKLQKKYPDWVFHFVGTRCGIERAVVEKEGLIYHAIPSAKLRRYMSIHTLLDFFNFACALVVALFLLLRIRPQVLISAGSSVSVPLHWIARVLHMPTLIHQQDVKPGLANRLMKHGATRITVACPESVRFFNADKTVCIGNPVREELKAEPVYARATLKLEENVPVILFMGGGTGALHINRLVEKLLPQLTPVAQVIHLTGKDKSNIPPQAHYRSYDFLDAEGMRLMYAAADVVVTRAGFSTITELSYLGKAAVLIPIPGSHQEANARYCEEHGAARAVYNVSRPGMVAPLLIDLLKSPEQQTQLAAAMHNLLPRDAAQKMADIVEELVG
ncbi:MAG TPA: hypothetical protein DDW36_00605 [Candidatus Magasanikbacteria bacterium]|nr:hypothetical protein [Candidatus Magasanikbacteria bacterium]